LLRSLRPDKTRHCERSEATRFPREKLDCFVAEFIVGPATSGPDLLAPHNDENRTTL
jgi:hypothetical protein